MVGPACPEAGPAAVPGGEGMGGHRASPCQGGGSIQPISRGFGPGLANVISPGQWLEA